MPQRGGQSSFARNTQCSKFVASLGSDPVPLRFAEVVCQSVCGAPDPFYVSSFDSDDYSEATQKLPVHSNQCTEVHSQSFTCQYCALLAE